MQKETAKHRAIKPRSWGYAAWIAAITGFALLHAWHLRADFPNGSPWVFDWAKFTDEGWYGNAAIRAHLFGNWYLAGDFNPAVAVPVWPFLEWALFFFTGVTIEAARGLAIACFFLNLALSYLLLRNRVARWMALLGVTLLVTSPFLYCFSRLAILEPLQTTLTLTALNLAVRLKTMRRPVRGGAWRAVCAHRFDEDHGTFPVAGPALGDGRAVVGRSQGGDALRGGDDRRRLRNVRRVDGSR